MNNSDLASETAGRSGRESKAKDAASAAAAGRPEADPESVEPEQDEPEVRLNVEVPESRRERLKARCKNEGRTLKYVLNRLVEHYAGGGQLP